MASSIDFHTKQLLTPTCVPPGYVVSLWPLIRAGHGSQLLTAYNTFAAALEPILPPNCELYPPSALHVTIATLSSFTNGTTVNEHMLAAVLDRAKQDPEWPSVSQLAITVQEPTLSEGFVGFFFNHATHVASIRDCLKRAAVGTSLDIKCPGIVHSTFLRFIDSTAVPNDFRIQFEHLAAQMKPTTVTCPTIDLIRESMPYMHMSLPARRHLVHQVPVAPVAPVVPEVPVAPEVLNVNFSECVDTPVAQVTRAPSAHTTTQYADAGETKETTTTTTTTTTTNNNSCTLSTDEQNYQTLWAAARNINMDTMTKTDQEKMLALTVDIANRLWQPRVLAGDKYKLAWSLLRLDEQKSLEAQIFDLKIGMQQLQRMFSDWLFDENNWTDFGQYGKSVSDALVDDQFATSREPILTLFRHVRANESFAVMNSVQKFSTRVYSEIKGNPGPIQMSTVEGEQVYQFVPALMEGKGGAVTFTFKECSADVQHIVREAASLVNNGFKPCGPVFDGGVWGVGNAETSNQVSYNYYLVARGTVVQQRFHAAVAESVAMVDGVEFLPAAHKKDKRLVGKAKEYNREGVTMPSYRALRDTVRCSIICQDHSSLVAAHAALLAVFTGKITKDRREEPSCRDVLQVVEFEGFFCEVQFHFAATLPLKVFSHAAYTVRRPEDVDLNVFKTLFDFPFTHMETETRDKVSCKLHF